MLSCSCRLMKVRVFFAFKFMRPLNSTYYTVTRMANVKKWTIPSVGRDVEQLELTYTAGGHVNWFYCCGRLFSSVGYP